MRRLPGSELVIVGWAGHDFRHEREHCGRPRSLCGIGRGQNCVSSAQSMQTGTDRQSELKSMSQQLRKAKSAVVTVGDGRGFVVNHGHSRLVVTAAQCLPFFPHGESDLGEKTHKILAPLGSEPTVWAQCLFADPIADIAVLGSPDGQGLPDEAKAYEVLLKSATPLSIADGPEQGRGWVLSLERHWLRCTVQIINDGSLWIPNTSPHVVPGMAGSPIISDSVEAIGVLSLGTNLEGWKNPRLVRDLPGWVLDAQRD